MILAVSDIPGNGSSRNSEPVVHKIRKRSALKQGSAGPSPMDTAKAVGLTYVSDRVPGIRREKSGEGFKYRAHSGKIIHDRSTLSRIKSLAIPPAWTDVWICPNPDGHLQATGRDARRRKQHRYHRRWREVRDETKYARMIGFAKALEQIRRRVSKDLKLMGLPRNKVLATVVRLLEVSLIRVGNDEYARDNDSFGLTTMKDRHVDVRGSTLRFRFRGKSGKMHEIDIRNRRMAKIVKRCQDLPGQELFQYVNEEGKLQDVRSNDVNDYLREITGQDYTAKDFRTWAGTVLGAMALSKFEAFESQTQAKKNIVQAIESVAERLGNTPAVCRKCYIHPEVLSAYMDQTLVATLATKTAQKARTRSYKLRADEKAVLHLLKQRLASQRRREKSLPQLLRQSIASLKKTKRKSARA